MEGVSLYPLELQVRLGSNAEDSWRLRPAMKPADIAIAPLPEVATASFASALIEDVHIVQCAIRDGDDARHAAA